MMRGTGVPGGRRARVRRLGVAVLAIALASSIRGAGAAPPAPSPGDDPDLNRSTRMISNAFISERPEPLAALVPSDGKVFISMMSVGGGAGYYSRDQVYFIFNKVFSQHDTLRFGLRRQKRDARFRDPEQPPDNPEFVYCIGSWSYHRHDGVDSEIRIHFVLSLKKGGWSIVEIREVQ